MEGPPPPSAPEEEPNPGVLARFGGGVRLSIGVILFLPFLVFLVPIWYIHRWNEVRQGRPPPPPPWKDEEEWYARHKGDATRATPPEPLFTMVEEEREERPREEAPILFPDTVGVALVTGGGRRLGAFLARELAVAGYAVAVGYHHSERQAAQLVAEIEALGRPALAWPLDLGQPEASERIVEEVSARLGPLSLLINNAGLFLPTTLDTSWEALESLLAVNLRGPLWLSLKAARVMVNADGGQIINIADIWGERPLKGHGAYSASKAGLIMATRALSRDLAPEVRVNAIAPGAVLPPEEGQDRFARLLERTPLSREAAPAAVWHAVRYLLAARFVTGEVLHVDGGRSWGG